MKRAARNEEPGGGLAASRAEKAPRREGGGGRAAGLDLDLNAAPGLAFAFDLNEEWNEEDEEDPEEDEGEDEASRASDEAAAAVAAGPDAAGYGGPDGGADEEEPEQHRVEEEGGSNREARWADEEPRSGEAEASTGSSGRSDGGGAAVEPAAQPELPDFFSRALDPLPQGFDLAELEIVEATYKAHGAKDVERLVQVLDAALAACGGSPGSPSKYHYLSCLVVAKQIPEAFLLDAVFKRLLSFLMPPEEGLSATIKKGMNLLPLLACRLLHQSLASTPEWPLELVQAYLEDFVGPRTWVERDSCKDFVATLLTAFPDPDESGDSVAGDGLLENVVSAPAARSNPLLLGPYEREAQQQGARQLFLEVLSRLLDQASVKDNPRQLMRLLSLGAGWEETRVVGASMLSPWLNNALHLKQAKELTWRIIKLNCGTSDNDYATLSHLLSIKIKALQGTSITAEIIARVVKTNSDCATFALKTFLLADLQKGSPLNSKNVVTALKALPESPLPELQLALVFQELATDVEHRPKISAVIRRLVRHGGDISARALCRGLMQPWPAMWDQPETLKSPWLFQMVELVSAVLVQAAVPFALDESQVPAMLSREKLQAATKFWTEVAAVQEEAVAWSSDVLAAYLPAITDQEFLSCICKLLTLEDLVKDGDEKRGVEAEKSAEVDMAGLRLMSRSLPVTEATLARIIVMGLSDGNPLSRESALEVLDHLILRAAEARQRIPAALHATSAQLSLALLKLSSPEAIASTTVAASQSGNASLFGKACLAIVVLAAANPVSIGAFAWTKIPSVKLLMEALITCSAHPYATSHSSPNGRGTAQAHVISAPSNASEGPGADDNLSTSLTHQAMPPGEVWEELHRRDAKLGLGRSLRASRSPDWLLEIAGSQDIKDAWAWLREVLERDPGVCASLPTAWQAELFYQLVALEVKDDQAMALLAQSLHAIAVGAKLCPDNSQEQQGEERDGPLPVPLKNTDATTVIDFFAGKLASKSSLARQVSKQCFLTIFGHLPSSPAQGHTAVTGRASPSSANAGQLGAKAAAPQLSLATGVQATWLEAMDSLPEPHKADIMAVMVPHLRHAIFQEPSAFEVAAYFHVLAQYETWDSLSQCYFQLALARPLFAAGFFPHYEAAASGIDIEGQQPLGYESWEPLRSELQQGILRAVCEAAGAESGGQATKDGRRAGIWALCTLVLCPRDFVAGAFQEEYDKLVAPMLSELNGGNHQQREASLTSLMDDNQLLQLANGWDSRLAKGLALHVGTASAKREPGNDGLLTTAEKIMSGSGIQPPKDRLLQLVEVGAERRSLVKVEEGSTKALKVAGALQEEQPDPMEAQIASAEEIDTLTRKALDWLAPTSEDVSESEELLQSSAYWSLRCRMQSSGEDSSRAAIACARAFAQHRFEEDLPQGNRLILLLQLVSVICRSLQRSSQSSRAPGPDDTQLAAEGVKQQLLAISRSALPKYATDFLGRIGDELRPQLAHRTTTPAAAIGQSRLQDEDMGREGGIPTSQLEQLPGDSLARSLERLVAEAIDGGGKGRENLATEQKIYQLVGLLSKLLQCGMYQDPNEKPEKAGVPADCADEKRRRGREVAIAELLQWLDCDWEVRSKFGIVEDMDLGRASLETLVDVGSRQAVKTIATRLSSQVACCDLAVPAASRAVSDSFAVARFLVDCLQLGLAKVTAEALADAFLLQPEREDGAWLEPLMMAVTSGIANAQALQHHLAAKAEEASGEAVVRAIVRFQAHLYIASPSSLKAAWRSDKRRILCCAAELLSSMSMAQGKSLAWNLELHKYLQSLCSFNSTAAMAAAGFCKDFGRRHPALLLSHLPALAIQLQEVMREEGSIATNGSLYLRAVTVLDSVRHFLLPAYNGHEAQGESLGGTSSAPSKAMPPWASKPLESMLEVIFDILKAVKGQGAQEQGNAVVVAQLVDILCHFVVAGQHSAALVAREDDLLRALEAEYVKVKKLGFLRSLLHDPNLRSQQLSRDIATPELHRVRTRLARLTQVRQLDVLATQVYAHNSTVRSTVREVDASDDLEDGYNEAPTVLALLTDIERASARMPPVLSMLENELLPTLDICDPAIEELATTLIERLLESRMSLKSADCVATWLLKQLTSDRTGLVHSSVQRVARLFPLLSGQREEFLQMLFKTGYVAATELPKLLQSPLSVH